MIHLADDPWHGHPPMTPDHHWLLNPAWNSPWALVVSATAATISALLVIWCLRRNARRAREQTPAEQAREDQ